MAIRRRVNELFIWSVLLLLFANVYLYFKEEESDRSNLERRDIRNDSEFDYISPPPCRKPIEEAIRLNELIANAWYKCKRVKRIPDESLGHQVCVDDAVGIQHVLSGDRLTFVTLAGTTEDFRLEKTLLKIANSNRILSGLIFGSRPTYPTALRDYTKYILYSAISSADLLDIPKFATDLTDRISSFARNRGEGEIDILKITCIDCWHPEHLPRLLNELISLNCLTYVRQLHLIVKIEEQDPKLLYLWYRTIHRLFYAKGVYFTLYAAQQLGECGRIVRHCQYQLAFAKVDAAPVGATVKVLAPVAGMGSPDEEYNRLIWYLRKKFDTNVCEGRQRGIDFGGALGIDWTICDRFTQETISDTQGCLIYHFSIGDALSIVDGQWQKNFPSACSIHLFDPTLPYDQNYNAEKASLYSLTLADKNSGKTQPGLKDSKTWRLSTMQDVLERTNAEKRVISLLIVDLQGGEWDIFEQILSAASTSVFSQLVMRIRLWEGEENENYRQYYTWLHRMHKAGYHLFSHRPFVTDNSTNVLIGNECKANSCFELGWVLT